MKNPTHKLALYTATILISALSFTTNAKELTDKTKGKSSVTTNTEINPIFSTVDPAKQTIEVSQLKSRFVR